MSNEATNKYIGRMDEINQAIDIVKSGYAGVMPNGTSLTAASIPKLCQFQKTSC